MKYINQTLATRMSICLAAALISTQSLAQLNINITLAPPAPIYETIPMMEPGYIWAPGYWAWHDDRHIWIRGRTIVQRTGYRWEPDRWDQRGSGYYQTPGRWQQDNSRPIVTQHRSIKPQLGYDKDDKHGKGNGNGNRNKNERGRQQER